MTMRIPFPLIALAAAVALTLGAALGDEQKAGKIRCLIFVTEFCEPCNKLKNEVLRLPREWKVGTKDDCDFQFVNAADKPELAKKYKADRYPTTVVIDQNGKQIGSFVGFTEGKTLAKWLSDHRKRER